MASNLLAMVLAMASDLLAMACNLLWEPDQALLRLISSNVNISLTTPL